MAKIFDDKFTLEEETFTQQITKVLYEFKNSNYFHSQILEIKNSKEAGVVGKLIESIIKYNYFKYHSNYEKNLSSEPYLKHYYPKTDLHYHNNDLQIKTINSTRFDNKEIVLIKEKFNSKQKTKCKIELSKFDLKEYKKKF